MSTESRSVTGGAGGSGGPTGSRSWTGAGDGGWGDVRRWSTGGLGANESWGNRDLREEGSGEAGRGGGDGVAALDRGAGSVGRDHAAEVLRRIAPPAGRVRGGRSSSSSETCCDSSDSRGEGVVPRAGASGDTTCGGQCGRSVDPCEGSRGPAQSVSTRPPPFKTTLPPGPTQSRPRGSF